MDMENSLKAYLVGKLKSAGLVHREYASSGEFRSGIYVDIKAAYGHPDIFGDICDSLWESIEGQPNCIAAAGYGGLPPSSVLAERYDLKFSMVRQSPKSHADRGLFDGYAPKEGDNVVIIDDVVFTGESLSKVADTVKLTGAGISGCHVVFKRGSGTLLLPVKYLFSEQDFLDG